MRPRWSGVFPAVTTQFHENQALDLAGTERHLAALLDAGVHGLIVCGSLGENQTLDPGEKAPGGGAGASCGSEKGAGAQRRRRDEHGGGVPYVRDCEKLGADGFMVMPAMVYKADGREALNHFRRVAAATGLPWMLYNNPVGYPVDITPGQFAELADIPNLVAIKESSANTRRITELRIEVGDRYALFVGVDDLLLESAVLGIDGWVAGSGIAFPRENQYFWELTRAGRWEEARALYRWFYPLLKLDTNIKFVQYIKLAVQEVGLGREWVREPRLPLAGAEREQILTIIRHGIEHRPTQGVS